MVPRQRRRLPLAPYQGPQPHIHRQHIGPARRPCQIPPRGIQNKINLLVKRPRLEARPVHRRIGRSSHRVPVPRNHKQYPSIARPRHHQRRLALQKRPVKDQVNPLARHHQRLGVRVSQPPHLVRKDPRRIHHHPRRNRQIVSRLGVARHQAIDITVGISRHLHRWAIVHQRCAVVRRRHRQVNQQPRVVELPIIIDDAAAQLFGLQRRQQRQRLLLAQHLRRAKPILACQHVIQLQPNPVKRRLPPRVVRHHKRQIVHQVRRVLPQQPALL